MPYKNPADRKAWNVAYAQRIKGTPKHKASQLAKKPIRTFIGVDGEGGTLVPGERQEYLLLRAGKHVLETGSPLTADECLSFLADLPTGVIYVAYAFNYDVTMMLRDLPMPKLKRLLDREARVSDGGWVFPVDVLGGKFQVDMIDNKEFKVRRCTGRNAKGTRVFSPWIVINDVFSFFQTGFAKTLRQWYTNPDEELCGLNVQYIIGLISAGKDKRNSFGAVDAEERYYNMLECAMLGDLMHKFRRACIEADLPMPKQWQGPGNIAAALFLKHGFPRRGDKNPAKCQMVHIDYPDVVKMANDAYYGGRFEPIQYGLIQGPVYQYDLNSAYAAMYQELPCLVHGTWEHITEQPDGGIYFAEVDFTFVYGTDRPLCILPYRAKNGAILYPLRGQGTYPSPELELAREHNVRFKTFDGWKYVPGQCDHDNVFHWVPAMYAHRKALELSGDTRGTALKIALASVYGKLAQSVGDPVYSNPIWASLITGTVRARLVRAALSENMGSDLVMLATDAMFTTKPRNVPISGKLGDWSVDEYENILVVQSGLYLKGADLKNKVSAKTRGLPLQTFMKNRDEIRSAWDTFIANWGPDKMPDATRMDVNTFHGLRSSVHRNKPEIAGTWEIVPHDVRFEWGTKRVPEFMESGTVYTVVYRNGPTGHKSKPYDKNIGRMMADGIADPNHIAMSLRDNPDWSYND